MAALFSEYDFLHTRSRTKNGSVCCWELLLPESPFVQKSRVFVVYVFHSHNRKRPPTDLQTRSFNLHSQRNRPLPLYSPSLTSHHRTHPVAVVDLKELHGNNQPSPCPSNQWCVSAYCLLTWICKRNWGSLRISQSSSDRRNGEHQHRSQTANGDGEEDSRLFNGCPAEVADGLGEESGDGRHCVFAGLV